MAGGDLGHSIMAKRQVLQFPLRGLTDTTNFTHVGDRLTLEALNVQSVDPLTGRIRGSLRPGTSRVVAEPVDHTDNNLPVQRMGQVTLADQRPIGEINTNWTWDDPVISGASGHGGEVGSGPNGDGVGSGWLRDEPTYFLGTNWPSPDPQWVAESINAGSLSVDSVDIHSATISYGQTTGGSGSFVETLQIQQNSGGSDPAYPLGEWVSLGSIDPNSTQEIAGLDTGEQYTFRVRIDGYIRDGITDQVSATTTYTAEVTATPSGTPTFTIAVEGQSLDTGACVGIEVDGVGDVIKSGSVSGTAEISMDVAVVFGQQNNKSEDNGPVTLSMYNHTASSSAVCSSTVDETEDGVDADVSPNPFQTGYNVEVAFADTAGDAAAEYDGTVHYENIFDLESFNVGESRTLSNESTLVPDEFADQGGQITVTRKS